MGKTRRHSRVAWIVLAGGLTLSCPAPAQETGGERIAVSAASYAPVVSPSSFASIFTPRLDNVESKTAKPLEDGALPRQVDGVSVQVDNVEAGIVSVSPGRVDFVVPADARVGRQPVAVFRGEELLTRGEVEVSLTAPAVFAEDGSGRGTALARNSITGEPGPFRVITQQPGSSAAPTVVRLVTTGLRFAGNPDRDPTVKDVSGQVRARLVRASGQSVTLTVVRCVPWNPDLALDRPLPSPLGVGLDELAISLPPGAAGTGDNLLLIETDDGVSRPVVLTFRPTAPVTVSTVSPAQVRPGETVTIRGSGFAAQLLGDRSTRNVASLRADNGRVLPVLVVRADASTMDAVVLPSAGSVTGELFQGRATVCVETDSESACSRTPILQVEPIQSLQDPAGEKWLEYLHAFHAQLLTASEPILPSRTMSRLRDEMTNSEIRNRNLVEAARAGIPEVQRFENAEDGRTVEFWFDEAFFRVLDASIQKASTQRLVAFVSEGEKTSLAARRAEGDCGLSGESFALEAKRLRDLIDKGEQVLSITVAVIDGIMAARGCATAVACTAALKASTWLAAVYFWAPFADIVELEYNNNVLLESLQLSPPKVKVNPRSSVPFRVDGRFVSRQGNELLFDFAKRIVLRWLESKLNSIGVVKKGQIVDSVLGRAVDNFLTELAGYLVDRTIDDVRGGGSAELVEMGSRSALWCCSVAVAPHATLQLANVNPCRATSATGVQASTARDQPYSVIARSEVLWLHEFQNPPLATLKVTVTSVPTLQKLTIPTSVTGGGSFQGRIDLGAPAPASGFALRLRSSSPSVQLAAEEVRVPQGATSATFEATTSRVTDSTAVILTATAGEDSVASTVSVNPPLPAPTQTSPASGTWFRNDPFPRNMTFSWQPVNRAADYRVEIEYYCSTWAPWISTVVAETRYDRAFVGSQPGRWRVSARDSSGASSEVSPWWGFDFSPNPALLSFPASTCKTQTNAALAAPALAAPAEGASFDTLPRTLTLRWNPVAGVTRYGVQVDYGSGGRWSSDTGTFAALTTVEATTVTVTFTGAQPGRWRVWAIDEFAQHGTKSDWRTFRFLK